MSICVVDVPLMKDVPKRQQCDFAAKWSDLLSAALSKQSAESWFDFFVFPKCILLAPPRGGKRLSKSRSRADIVQSRLSQWEAGNQGDLWKAVLARGAQRKPPKFADRDREDTYTLEREVVKALRMGDVRKALQMFTAAPIAPKSDETFEALKALHPSPQGPVYRRGALRCPCVFG